MNKRLLIVGPPGSGKGTQSEYIAKHYNIINISTGDIFRNHIKNKTSLGLKVQQYTKLGQYVPDNIINDMIDNCLMKYDIKKKGFLLDGYPRTFNQIHFLDKILEQNNCTLDGVIELFVEKKELVNRMLNRAKILGRDDDTLDIIYSRQEIYEKETKPILNIYRKRNIVKQINGMGDFLNISKKIINTIDSI